MDSPQIESPIFEAREISNDLFERVQMNSVNPEASQYVFVKRILPDGIIFTSTEGGDFHEARKGLKHRLLWRFLLWLAKP